MPYGYSTYCGSSEPTGACGTALTDWCDYHNGSSEGTTEEALEAWRAYVDAQALRLPGLAATIERLYGRL